MPANYYPPISLKEATRLARLILESNAGHPMYRLTAADELGLKDGSDTFRSLITASYRYGLTKGSYKAEKLEFDDRARAVLDGDPSAALDVLFENEYFAKVHQRYVNNAVPGDKLVEDFLKESGLGADFIAGVRKGIFQNMRDWGLIKKMGGGDRIVPRDMVEGATKPKPQTTEQKESPQEGAASATDTPTPERAPQAPPAPVRPQVTLSPNLQVNIEIHIAADTPHETIEKIFESMGKHVMSNAGAHE